MTSLLDLKSTQHHHVLDLVDQAGFDVELAVTLPGQLLTILCKNPLQSKNS